MADQKLIMTIGLPRSGKSTWAKQQGVPIVSTDAIRMGLHGHDFIGLAEPIVWAIAKIMVRSLFIAGHDTVILDSTSVTKHRRLEWRSSSWRREFKVFDTPKEECLRRATENGRDYLLPVIEKMASEWEDLGPEDVDE